MALPTELPGIVLTLVAWNNYAPCSASCPRTGDWFRPLGKWGPRISQLNHNSIFLLQGTPGSGATVDISIYFGVLFDMRNCYCSGQYTFFPPHFWTGSLCRATFVSFLFWFFTHSCVRIYIHEYLRFTLLFASRVESFNTVCVFACVHSVVSDFLRPHGL